MDERWSMEQSWSMVGQERQVWSSNHSSEVAKGQKAVSWTGREGLADGRQAKTKADALTLLGLRHDG